jgi:hypothetical protein
MFCTKCGTKINDSVKFCTTCGNAVPEAVDAHRIVPEEKTDIAEKEHYEKPLENRVAFMSYLISVNNQQSGPYSLAQLQNMIKNSQITLAYWVCGEGSANWIPVDKMPELKAVFDGGSENSASRTEQPQAPENNTYTMHGFTIFWLWGSLIVCGLSFIMNFVADFKDWYSFSTADLIFLQAIALINGKAYLELLGGSRGWFWLLALTGIVFSIWDPYKAGQPACFISNTISLVILYGILHLRNRDGISVWEPMKR